MRPKIMFLFIMLLSACFHKPVPVSFSHIGGFILEDTSRSANAYLQSFEDDGFPIYYLGPSKDTINIGTRYWQREECRFKEYPAYWILRYSTCNISVQVDTSYPACDALEYLNKDRSIDHYCDSNRYYHASIVIIRNLCDTAVSLGITYNVSQMHREMMNSRGQWVKVNKKLCEQGICGTGQPNIYLMPGELIISKVDHFNGSHAIPCRLALGRSNTITQIYSNTFNEYVNDSLLHVIDDL
ncbi:hypothetical protein [Chitinophaga sp. Cy-1792]|uniref:hypothetical protein n=1 Tax=Chitinophaga sp. Cy-1792 TaxID=2608339 RepID=UPI00141E3472|nr:hypothetical protein [Chitinophaga sp. Cy-1792]NIG53395.1 hypothetical protein [Chitinophaga sp. Cy-1792]